MQRVEGTVIQAGAIIVDGWVMVWTDCAGECYGQTKSRPLSDSVERARGDGKLPLSFHAGHHWHCPRSPPSPSLQISSFHLTFQCPSLTRTTASARDHSLRSSACAARVAESTSSYFLSATSFIPMLPNIRMTALDIRPVASASKHHAGC